MSPSRFRPGRFRSWSASPTAYPSTRRKPSRSLFPFQARMSVAQTVEPELTDHRLIPSLHCGVFRRRVSTQQFVDPSPQPAGTPVRERRAAIRALRARNCCRISDSIPASATSVFTAEAAGARPTIRKPLFTAGVRALSGRRVRGSAMTSPPGVRGRSSSTPRFGRLFSARGRVIGRWSSRRRSLP